MPTRDAKLRKTASLNNVVVGLSSFSWMVVEFHWTLYGEGDNAYP